MVNVAPATHTSRWKPGASPSRARPHAVGVPGWLPASPPVDPVCPSLVGSPIGPPASGLSGSSAYPNEAPAQPHAPTIANPNAARVLDVRARVLITQRSCDPRTP